MLQRIDPDRALEVVLERTPRGAEELVPVVSAAGRVVAETVRADRDYPPFDRAMMDGYAVRVADAGLAVQVRGEVAAGAEPSRPVEAGSALSIMTGAPCPGGTEAVVPVEDVRPREQGVRTGEQGVRTGEQGVRLPPGIVSGQHIVARGAERRAGDAVAEAGSLVTPLSLAVLVSVG